VVTTSPARERLVSTAAELFYRNGIAATGVDTVARVAEVSKPTLYAHFRSKTDLVVEVLTRRHAQRAAELMAYLAGVPVGQRTLAIFDWYADWYAHDGARGCAFLNAAAEVPDPADPVRLAVRAEKRWLHGLLAELARDDALRDPDAVGVQLLLLIDGVGARVLVEGPPAGRSAVGHAAAAAAALVAAARQAQP